jgi:hypothetical protein
MATTTPACQTLVCCTVCTGSIKCPCC